MKVLQLTMKYGNIPVLVNVNRIDYIQPKRENKNNRLTDAGCVIYFSGNDEPLTVVDSIEEIELKIHDANIDFFQTYVEKSTKAIIDSVKKWV